MPLFFSPGAVAFFDDAIHENLPFDAVAITEEMHRQIMGEQATGRIIAAGADGLPITVDPPQPTEAQLLSALRRCRNRLLAECDHSQMADFILPDDQRDAWRIYRQALRDLPETITDPANIEWPLSPTA